MTTMPGTSASQDVARRLADDGYVVVTGIMTPEGVQNAKADLDRVLRTTRTGRNSFEGFDTQRIYALFAKTRVFDALATDPLLLGVLDQVLGHYQLSAPVGICIGPGEKAQVLHRDDGIYPVPEPHPPLVVNTMWPLDEFTAENGATRYIPGSHRWEPGRRPGPNDPVETAVMSPGSALFYLGSLWHGGGANQTSRPRLGVILEYAAGWLRPQENHCLAVPREVVRDLPERLQELLGYNIYPPFVGYVDGRHPRQVLSAGLLGKGKSPTGVVTTAASGASFECRTAANGGHHEPDRNRHRGRLGYRAGRGRGTGGPGRHSGGGRRRQGRGRTNRG